jgi:hypothetical protein
MSDGVEAQSLGQVRRRIIAECSVSVQSVVMAHGCGCGSGSVMKAAKGEENEI